MFSRYVNPYRLFWLAGLSEGDDLLIAVTPSFPLVPRRPLSRTTFLTMNGYSLRV